MLRTLITFFSAFRAGNQVQNPAGWKRIGIKVNIVAAILGVFSAWAYSKGYIQRDLTTDEIVFLLSSVGTAISALSSVILSVTSRKVGVGQSEYREQYRNVQEYTPITSFPVTPQNIGAEPQYWDQGNVFAENPISDLQQWQRPSPTRQPYNPMDSYWQTFGKQ